MRNWVEASDGNDGSIVFVSARYVDMSVCSQLLTLWLDTAMNTLMAMDRSSALRLWFFVDELGALHRLPALEKGRAYSAMQVGCLDKAGALAHRTIVRRDTGPSACWST